MLKLAGCLLIFAASGGMAYSLVLGLHSQIWQMERLLHLIVAIEGEVSYCRCPLPELLLQLAGHQQEPYKKLLLQASRQMEDNKEADIPALWQEICGQFEKELDIPKEAYQVLLRVGEVFSYTSLESSVQLLQFGKKRLAETIECRSAQYADRKKLYCCLCYMAGFCAVILLL